MRNYIILNNQNSNTINGLIIQELAPISKPLQRTQVETIDGRDGDIVTPLGYAAYDKKITIGLYGDFDINEIIAYFATQGTAIFSNEPNKYYNYQILDQIDYERLVRFRVATVTMHVQPFKYSATEGTITVDSSDTVSGEGSDIALDGTAEAPFTTLRHKGNATQTTYSGKNLLPSINTTRTRNGVTFTHNDDGSISLSGTATADTAYPINVNSTGNARNVPLSAGNYIVSGGSATSPTTVYMQAYYGTIGGADRYSMSTFTLEADGTMGAYIYVKSGVNTSGKTIYPMVEQGSTATAYEPYVGGTPAPNPSYPQPISTVTGEQTVKVEGKNLFDMDDFLTTAEATYTKNGNQYSITAWGNLIQGRYPLNAINGNTYTLSLDAISQGTANTRIQLYKNGTLLATIFGGTDQQTHSYTFTADGSQYALNATYSSPFSSPVIFKSPQLELGSTATTYEPYKEQSYVLPFGDTYLAGIGNYADEPVKVGDTWYIRRAIGKVVLNGSENWTLYPNKAHTFRCGAPHTMVNAISDHFVSIPSSQFDTVVGTYTTNTGIFIISYPDMADVASFKAWLANNPTTFYYAVATPTDEEITDQDLIDALDELYDQAHSYKGHTHITATAADGNAPAVLSVEVGEDNESTVTNAGNTTSRPILTIYGQGDIGVYINDVEVLDIALGNEQYITLDSTEMDAYKDSPANLKNRLVTGDYSKLALNAGANKIRFTGIVTKYEISKYSRWL